MIISGNSLLAQNPSETMDEMAAQDSELESKLKYVETMLPAIVVAYDRETNLATVRAAIVVQMATGVNMARHEVFDIPVLSMGAGGFHINFPVKVGDLGWIESTDRDISLFIQTLTDANPATARHHMFTSARFIPDVFYKYAIAAEDADAMVIQGINSNSRIAVAQDQIRIVVGATRIVVDGSSVHVTTTNATVDATKTVINSVTTINGGTTINGDTLINGTLTATGTATLAGGMNSPSASINSRDFMSHNHSDPGDSGPHNTGGVN